MNSANEDDSHDIETMNAVLSALNPDTAVPRPPEAPDERPPVQKPVLRVVGAEETAPAPEPPQPARTVSTHDQASAATAAPDPVPAKERATGVGSGKVTAKAAARAAASPRRPARRAEVDGKPVAPARPATPKPEETLKDRIAEAVEDAAQPERAPKRSGPSLSARMSRNWQRWQPIRPYLYATLSPVPLLILAGIFGGVWSFLALLWMTGLLFAMDEVAMHKRIAAPDPQATEMADQLSVRLAGVHFLLLPFAVWSLSGGAGHGFFGWIATFLAFGLWFGQVSNSNAHELIHRTNAWLFRAGMWVYISLLFGHHTSAHRLVHHRFVATVDDPNTAAEGENFYLFAARAWPGAFIAGYEMEQYLLEQRDSEGWRDLNPYTLYIAGGIGFTALMLLAFGFDGLLAYLLLCAHAQVQLLLSDYVQHYGLLRRELPSGALEPAGIGHSWDAPHPISGFMMLNAPRHADHHAHPTRPYPELQPSPRGAGPMLPYSLPAMATIALVPHAWHRIMDKRLARLRA